MTALFLMLLLAGANDAARIERRVFDGVNRVRVEYGLQPLEWHAGTAAAARTHAMNMAGRRFFSHTDPVYGDTGGRMTRRGIRWSAVAENIFYSEGYENPVPEAVEAWMDSPGHRQNILAGRFTHSGVGTALSADGKRYFVQIFLLPRPTAPSSR